LLEGDSICPGDALAYVPEGRGGRRVREGSRTWCVMFTCSFCRFTQAALEPASGQKWHAASLGAVKHREAVHGLGVQDVTDFNSD
jgi:hypothetical protein